MDLELARKHLGCFRDDLSDRDLPLEVEDRSARGSVRGCIQACAQIHYMSVTLPYIFFSQRKNKFYLFSLSFSQVRRCPGRRPLLLWRVLQSHWPLL